MAQGEFSVLQQQCLYRRIATSELLQETAAWEAQRDQAAIWGQLEVHHRGCPGEAAVTLPVFPSVARY